MPSESLSGTPPSGALMRTNRRNVLPFLVAALSLAFLPPTQAGHPVNPLQPGDIVTGPTGQCTLDFVFDGPGGEVYFGIAAHCIDLGDTMSSTAYGGFGTAVYDDDAFRDFGLIQVAATKVAHVSPVVKGHPGTPTGYTVSSGTSLGDLVAFSGYGVGFGAAPATQEDRVGVLFSDSPTRYCVDGPVIFGDSGGPVIHVPTGKALGVVSHLAPECPAWLAGTTIEGAIARATFDGFPITLRTA